VIGGRVTGKKLDYDHAGMRFRNSAEATALLTPKYRKGFDNVPGMSGLA
jgi:hypothetical protein